MPATDDIAPPEQSVWTKYSPHHEFPLAGTASLLIHGIIVAGAFLIFIWLNFKWHGEENQPVENDVAYVNAAPGDGQSGGGGGGSPVGPPGSPQESVEEKTQKKPDFEFPPIVPQVQPIQPKASDVSDIQRIGDPAPATDINKAFANVEKNFKNSTQPGVPNGGGKGGVGTGTGTGDKFGPGSGNGPPGPPGSPGIPGVATRAEILAQRWNFTPTGNPREHVQKLVAAGVKVGFKDGNNLFWMIDDLRQRPAKFRNEPFEKYKDTVKWYSHDPNSVLGMAHELQMPAPPQQFILLLPQDREQKLADAERDYAKSRGHDLKLVTETWFDFNIVGGKMTPTVRAQVPFEARPKW